LDLIPSTIVKSRDKSSRVIRNEAALEKAVAIDPRFEWTKRGGQRAHRRVEGSSTVEPWTTEVRLHGSKETVAFTTRVDDAELKIVVKATGGAIAPHRITIEMPDGSALPASLFTRLRLTPVFDQMSRDFDSPVINYQLGMFDSTGWEEPFLQRPRPGREGRKDWEYALWASRYVSACEQDPARPIALLVKRFSGHKESMLRAILYKARRRGLLTDAPQKGRAGGTLTNKAVHLLKGIPADVKGVED
jgi:hypothetical protein